MFLAPVVEEAFSQSMSLRCLSKIRNSSCLGSLLGPLFCPIALDTYLCLTVLCYYGSVVHFEIRYCGNSSIAFSALGWFDCLFFGVYVCVCLYDFEITFVVVVLCRTSLEFLRGLLSVIHTFSQH